MVINVWKKKTSRQDKMAFFSDDQNVGGQLKVGIGIVPAIGEGEKKVNGSA